MSCNEILEIYLKSLRSEISPGESAVLREHLKTCSECRQALEWDSVIISAFRKDMETVPGEKFAAEVCREIVYAKPPLKERVYDFVTSSLDVFVPAFITCVLFFAFRKEIWNDLLPGLYYYCNLGLSNIQEWTGTLAGIHISDKLFLFENSKQKMLVLIGLGGLLTIITSLTTGLFAHKKY